jgi:hypothetical protein
VIISVTSGGFNGDTVDWPQFCGACHSKWQDTETMAHPGPSNPYGCTACQTCHNHGADWGEYDWVSGTNNKICP